MTGRESRKGFPLVPSGLSRSVWRQGERKRGRPTTIYSIKKDAGLQAQLMLRIGLALIWELGTRRRRGWQRVTEVVLFWQQGAQSSEAEECRPCC